MYRVFIADPRPDPFIALFQNYGKSGLFRGVKKVENADIVLFTGGPDLDPSYYGQKKLVTTMTSKRRDDDDIDIWMRVPDHALKVGICRGAQFLNVMAGGTLWQDVDGHREQHPIYERLTGSMIWATSTHHQMMIPGPDCRIIATAKCASEKHSDSRTWTRKVNEVHPNVTFSTGDQVDVEVCTYDEQKVLCFQPHPEHSGATRALRNFFMSQLMFSLIRSKI